MITEEVLSPYVTLRRLPEPEPIPKPKPEPLKENTPITEAVDKWMERARQLSPRTQYPYHNVISNFSLSLPESVETIGQLSCEFVESYIENIKDEYTPKTLKNYQSIVRAFHFWLVRQYGIKDIIQRKPKTIKTRAVKPKPEPKPLPVLKAPDGSNVIAEWLEYCRRYAKNTQDDYRSVISRFIKFLDIENIDQLNCRVIEQYISSLLGEGKKNATANRYLATIKSFCRWLARNYNVPNCTIGIQRLKTDPTEPRVLTWEEYKKILSVCNGQEEGDIARFLANTGVRCSELISLRWGNVSKDLKMLKVIGKGRKLRHIPLNEICRDILLKYERGLDDTRLDFVRHRTNRKSIYNICAKLAERAGIPRAGAHSFRHLFATELLRRGVPISHVSKLLGHSSIAITEKAYIHFQPDFLNGLTDVLVCLQSN